jgi:glycosyltransferase involved in cell wall biosynthesis
MKRVLVLNYEFPPLGGGASPVSYEIADRLSRTGDFDIDVVTMGYKGLPKYEEVNKNFRIHRVKCLRSKKEICHPWEQLTYLFFGYFKCCELLKKNKFDICHCHFIIPTGVLAQKLKNKFGLEYIITAHGSDVLGYNARFKKLYPFLIGAWKKILDDAKKITSPSNFLKDEILKAYNSPPSRGVAAPRGRGVLNTDKIEVIPNGIDTEKFKPQEKKKWIFSSGRLLVNKGFQYLIQAVSEEDIGYEVHIAGDGPMMSELKSLAEKSKTKIFFHGWLNNKSEEYKNLLEQSAIFVLASDVESFGMSILEAMCAGCAVITTNISGCADVVGDSGILVNSKDVFSLKKGILKLLSDKIMLRECQKKALEKVKE